MNILSRIFFAFTVAMTLLLMGCASPPVSNVVTQTKYVVIGIEERYLIPTEVVAPPPPKHYQPTEVVDWESEYQTLVKTMIPLYASIGACNADKLKARIDLQEKKKRYE